MHLFTSVSLTILTRGAGVSFAPLLGPNFARVTGTSTDHLHLRWVKILPSLKENSDPGTCTSAPNYAQVLCMHLCFHV